MTDIEEHAQALANVMALRLLRTRALVEDLEAAERIGDEWAHTTATQPERESDDLVRRLRGRVFVALGAAQKLLAEEEGR